ncbi:unnamed protein product [Mycena citricolor]|uniref:CCHC-type domain-containing protein n=1 Tax=Mycena citricolor TaxID=2018698 RepID=A0AAD2HFC2_9AGAR|nr:unnamed protein product [Mycena citricolor]
MSVKHPKSFAFQHFRPRLTVIAFDQSSRRIQMCMQRCFYNGVGQFEPQIAMKISQLLCAPPPSSTAHSREPDDAGSSHGSPPPPNCSPNTPFKVINRCTNCRQRGHNRKTCPLPETPKPPQPPPRPRAKGCCGLCGQVGHNRTSCRLGLPK